MYLHSKYKSIARAKCFTPGTPSSMETIGVKVMLITSGADFTVFAHWAWLWTRSSPPLLLKITVTSCKKLGSWVKCSETQTNRSIVSHMLKQVKNDERFAMTTTWEPQDIQSNWTVNLLAVYSPYPCSSREQQLTDFLSQEIAVLQPLSHSAQSQTLTREMTGAAWYIPHLFHQ